MSIIKSHDVTLYGGNNIDIILRPLCDDHLLYLYKWCADPEVLYWTEGGLAGINLSYGLSTVHQIYGGVSVIWKRKLLKTRSHSPQPNVYLH